MAKAGHGFCVRRLSTRAAADSRLYTTVQCLEVANTMVRIIYTLIKLPQFRANHTGTIHIPGNTYVEPVSGKFHVSLCLDPDTSAVWHAYCFHYNFLDTELHQFFRLLPAPLGCLHGVC